MARFLVTPIFRTVNKLKRFFRHAWPWISIIAGVAAAIFLSPAEPSATWWPAADWARHALTGLGVGILMLIVGAILGLVTGSIGLPGLTMNGAGSTADDLNQIRSQLADVIKTQTELTKTAAEALALSRQAMNVLLPKEIPAPQDGHHQPTRSSSAGETHA